MHTLDTAYATALDRCVAALRQRNSLDDAGIRRLILRDLPAGDEKSELMRCRLDLGLSVCPNSRVFVDPTPINERFHHHG